MLGIEAIFSFTLDVFLDYLSSRISLGLGDGILGCMNNLGHHVAVYFLDEIVFWNFLPNLLVSALFYLTDKFIFLETPSSDVGNPTCAC